MGGAVVWPVGPAGLFLKAQIFIFLLSLAHTYFYERVIKSKESARVGSSACNGGSKAELVRTRNS